MKSIIIVDLASINKKEIKKKVSSIKKIIKSDSTEYHVLLFCDDPDEIVLEILSENISKTIKKIDYNNKFHSMSEEFTLSVDKFVFEIGSGLGKISDKIFNSETATELKKLWWYTELSHKNSPVDPSWWTLFRFKIAKHYFKKNKYEDCIFIGDYNHQKLIEQFCNKSKIRFISVILNKKYFFWRYFLLRIICGLSYFVAVLLTKVMFRNDKLVNNKKTVLGYSWFPTSWNKRYGKFEDHYYGNSFELLLNDDRLNFNPIYRLYTDNEYIFPSQFLKRIKKIKNLLKINNGAQIIENYVNINDVLCNYLDIKNIYYFNRIKKHKSFKKIFEFEGVNTSSLFLPRLWRSIVLWFPHLLCLERSVSSITEKYKPNLVLLYCFEFSYGRAIINGTKKIDGVKLIGLQHGPITPMKLLYSGDSRELTSNQSTHCSVPIPDIFALDGEIAYNILNKRGIEKFFLNITGPMRLDNVWDFAREKNIKIDYTSKNQKILVAPGHNDTEFIVPLAIQAIEGTNYRLTIKSHPKVPQKYFDSIISKYTNTVNPNQIEVAKKGTIYSYMVNHDIFLTSYSSAGVEAIVFDLPIILLNSNRIPDMSLFNKWNKKILSANNPKQLKSHIELLTSDIKFRNNYQKILYTIFEKSFNSKNSVSSKGFNDFVIKNMA